MLNLKRFTLKYEKGVTFSMGNEQFFDDLKPWSKRKHRLLGKYLKPFIAKVASVTSNREIYCVDAFAGTAKYRDGSAGSPLLLAQVSDECAEWKDPVTLKIINVEADFENFKSLEFVMKSWEVRGIVTNINSEFQDAIPEILSIIGDSPALFFIDPFGSTSVHFSHLHPILQRTQKITELITNFDTDGLYRIARASLSENANPKTAETNEQNIDRIIGNNNWKTELQNRNLTTKEGEKVLLHEYMQNLTVYGYHVVAYPIREELDKNPKYHLVYCTRHTDGVELMNDFIRQEEDLLYGEHIESRLTLFEPENLANEEINLRRQNLRPIMKNYLEKQRTVTREQVIKNLVLKHFGYFDSKDYRTIFKEFVDSGKLTTTDMKTRIDKRVYNYLSNK